MELLSGTAHLQRGGRNPTDGAKNRARSLTVARNMLKSLKKNLFFMVIFGNVLNFLYFCAFLMFKNKQVMVIWYDCP